MRVAAPDAKSFDTLLDGMFEDVAVDRQHIEPPPERPPRWNLTPVPTEKRGAMLAPEHRQTADVAGTAPHAETTPDAGAVEIDQIEGEVVLLGNRQNISQREIPVEDPRVVDSPRQRTETAKKRMIID